jgi:hypothetical protein
MVSAWVLNATLVDEPNEYSQLGLFNAASQWRAFAVLIPTLAQPCVPSSRICARPMNRMSYQRDR